jgi:hypothetical protein
MNLEYAGAAILFIVMITVLYLLWRREHPRG